MHGTIYESETSRERVNYEELYTSVTCYHEQVSGTACTLCCELR